MFLSDMHIIVMHIDFLYTSQVLRIFISIFLWNHEMLHYLKMCFHGKKREKIIHLREWLMLAQVIIINQKMMKLSLKGVK
jgi:hypothetical protein